MSCVCYLFTKELGLFDLNSLNNVTYIMIYICDLVCL